MRTLAVAAVAASLAAAACIEPPRAAVSPNGVSELVQPGGSPPPTSPDANMPASLPPPLAPAAAVQGNATYRTGSTFIVVGSAFAAAGVAFVVLGVVLPCKLGDTDCPTPTDVQDQKSMGDAFLGLGVGAIITGVVMLGIGIPLAVVGANQARRELGYAFVADQHGFGVRF